ncbi:inositol monophosphatase [Halobellus salinus]|uniref:fructose-bisphosphatase n=1 Tax=Halobellus salinus TaxID=931585 RepID=A0A830EJH1_9EURY|nr:inositol monophosphatase family protein [Halobellus salinus]GGJ16297.1 inositol monophosphatase [Halobellus salinus]SMP30418.1 myo-inositol-1(or 4)-monophosphatase [Halobellus salinus]
MTDGTLSRARLAAVAERAVRAGGDYLADAFRDGPIDADYGTDDVKAAADRAAEERVLDVIREAYPDHAIHAEESGAAGDHRYEWIIDPLDGTNNFAAGLPSFATAACVRCNGRTEVAAVYEPLPDDLYLARRGAGATVDGEPITPGTEVSLSAGTVSFVVGLPALRDVGLRATADRIESAVGAESKRVINTWSPCVDWGLLARGGVEGLVAYYPDVYEQYAGELLAAAAGVQCRVLDPDTGAPVDPDADASAPTGVGNLYVGAATPETLDRLVDTTVAALSASGSTL